MKTKEELNALKVRIESLSKELHALSDEELEQVTGGVDVMIETKYKLIFDNRTTYGGDFEMIKY